MSEDTYSKGPNARGLAAGAPIRPEENPSLSGVAFGSVCLGFFMVLIDSTALNVALPSIRTDLTSGLTGLEWTVNSYTITMAGCLLGGGALADRLGARRLFGWALYVFVLASVACALSPGISMLVASRAVQGVAAGGLLPASLAVIAQMFPEPGARARAFTIWGGVSSLALVAGPVAGGALVSMVGWRAIFLINLPIGILTAIGLRTVRPTAGRQVQFDPLGQAAVAAMVGFGIGALVEGGSHGWDSPFVLILLAVTFLSGICFVMVERSAAHPVLPPVLFRQAGFSGAMLIGALYQLGAYGSQFAISLHLQHSWHLNALDTGLSFVPFATAWSFASFVLARIVSRTGPNRLLVAGALTATVGALALLPLGSERSWAVFFCGSCLLGLGAGLMGPSLPVVALRAVPPDHSGLASGSLNAFRQVGGAVGIACFGPIMNTMTSDGLRVCLAVVAGGFLLTGAVTRLLR